MPTQKIQSVSCSTNWNAIVKKGGSEAKRAFGAMMTMKKIDVAAIDAARRG